MRSALLGAMLVAASLASPQIASAQLFDFETQFSGAVNPTPSGWSYRYQANGVPNNNVRDGNYELLTFPSTTTSGGTIAFWDPNPAATAELPLVGKNTSGVPFVSGALSVAAGASQVHPNPNQIAVISWTAPAAGTADVSFLFGDNDPGGGNGIKYFVERGNSEFTLAQGVRANGAAATSGVVPGSLRVAAGETINFIVDPNGGDHSFDSSRVTASVNFTASAGSFTDYRAAADLIAFEAGASGPQAAAGINGVWSYGTSPTNGAGFTFTPYAAAEHDDSWILGGGEFQGWGPGDSVPAAVVNTTATAQSPCCGITPIDPDQMLLHPGDQTGTRDFSVVRWTAPGDGTVDLSAIWEQNHGGQPEIDALLNGTSLFPAGVQFAVPGDGTLLSLNEIAVLAGDTIDFIAGPNPVGGFGATSTGFDANIRFTAAAVPEPTTIALWSLVGLVGAAVALRKRRAKARG